MSAAVLISIRPKWCDLIASGEKTIEVRKTAPKLQTPFKCYIYETLDKKYENIGVYDPNAPLYKNFVHYPGKVIGEYICRSFLYLGNVCTDNWDLLVGSTHDLHKRLIVQEACMTKKMLRQYANGKFCVGWNISELVIYDKPKELSAFNGMCSKKALTDCDCGSCKRLLENGNGHCPLDWIKHAPQSWRYVEKLQ